jgi:hypothetical protein
MRPTQMAFMPEQHILEGVVVLHETIHEFYRKKMYGVLFKIGFEKAYDKVKNGVISGLKLFNKVAVWEYFSMRILAILFKLENV